MERRTFVRGIGAVTVAGALAGCSGGGGNGDDTNGGDTPTGGSGGEETISAPDEVDTYLNNNDTIGYEGSAVDMTGQDSVEISVGVGDMGYGFGPAAVAVSSGTEVTWVWTGNGGSHNVVSNNDAFESDLQSGAGETFSHTFEETGNYTYYCNPHSASGMHGAVIVE